MDELTRTLWEYARKYRMESCYDQCMWEEREENEKALVSSILPIKIVVPIIANTMINIIHPSISKKFLFSLLSLFKKI